MSVSILERPFGYSVTSTTLSGTVYNNSGLYSIDFPSAHGLVTGNHFYIKSDVEDYNGFLTVGSYNATQIVPLRNDGTQINFVKATTVTLYYLTGSGLFTVDWLCVHLPIIYRLSNTLWPTNSADTIRDITGVTNSNGFCALTLAGDIKATGTAEVLDFVKITGASNENLNGVWQIVSYTSDTSFTIDIPYDSGFDIDLTNNASIQYYYNNYVVKVQVWGGLNNGHEYYAQKPYELLATLNLIPDEDNICKFSISDILKKQIELENNLLLGTLPNNLDAFTMFFIKYGEEYDDSTQIYIGRNAVSYTSDLSNFEGRAANAMLPFKNVYSGVLSDYFNSGSSSQKFLTNWGEPTIFEGFYFDLSWINDTDLGDALYLKIQRYINNVLQSTTRTAIGDYNEGIYRSSIEVTGDEDEIVASIIYYSDTLGALSSGENNGSGTSWVIDSSPDVTLASDSDSSKYLRWPYHARSGTVLTFTYTRANGAVGDTINYYAGCQIENGTVDVESIPNQYALTTPAETSVQITCTQDIYYVYLRVVAASGSPVQAIISALTVTSSETAYTESKTITVDTDCVPAQAGDGIYLSWLNNLGGFDYWLFTAYKDPIIDITDSGETEVNLFSEWPQSYGEFADTSKRKQTFRDSREQIVVRSQHLTKEQVIAISKIKTSPLVQIVNSIYDRRTVLVDTDSFTVYKEENKLHEISFTITYTDDVPSQRV